MHEASRYRNNLNTLHGESEGVDTIPNLAG
jgi:hypothetical protein